MRYCGNCGGSFDPAALAERTCPWCGAAINRTGDIEFDDVWDAGLQPTQAPDPQSQPDADSFSALPTAPAAGFAIHDPHSPTVTAQRRRAFRPVALMALVALALVLVFGSALLLNNVPVHVGAGSGLFSFGRADSSQTATTSSTSAQGTQPTPTGGSLAGGPLASPASTSATGAATPTPSASATGSPGGDPTVTMVAGSQPALAVAPANIPLTVCLGSSAQFTVTNTGGSFMAWNATASRPAYKLSPQSGSLGSGERQTVTVSGISASGQITIAAPGAANAPQTVTINCKL